MVASSAHRDLHTTYRDIKFQHIFMRCTHACERMSSTQTLRGFNEITTFMCMRTSRRVVVLFTINTLDFVVMVLVLMLTVAVVVGDVCQECLYLPFHIFSERVYVCVCYVLCIQTHFRFKLFNFYYCSWHLFVCVCVYVSTLFSHKSVPVFMLLCAHSHPDSIFIARDT